MIRSRRIFIPGSGERIGDRDVVPAVSEPTAGSGSKRLAHEVLGVFTLLRDLLGDAWVALVIAHTHESHSDETREDQKENANCKRPPPGPPFQSPINKRNTYQQCRRDYWNDDDANDGVRPPPVFEPLKNRQVIPFRARYIWYRRGSLRSELGRCKMCKQAE